MKKLMLMSSFLFLFNVHPINEMTHDELALLAHAGLEQGWELDEWQVVMMNDMNIKDFDNITKRLQNSYFVSTFEDENAVIYSFESKNNNPYMNHSFEAVVPTQHNNETITLHLIISGNSWDEKASDYYTELTNRLKTDYNMQFARNFTCLKFQVSGIINIGLSIDEFWQKMKVVHTQEQYDNVQHSIYEKEIYGHSPLIGNDIEVNDEKINLQMALKDEPGNKKQVIVGTPMILNEY